MCTYDWVVCTLECILLKYIQIEKHKAWTSIQNPERASGPHYGHLMFVCNWYVNHRLSPSSWTFHPPTNSAGAVWQGQVTKSVLRHNALLEIPKFAYGIERPGRKWHMGAVMWFLLPRFHRSVSEKKQGVWKGKYFWTWWLFSHFDASGGYLVSSGFYFGESGKVWWCGAKEPW